MEKKYKLTKETIEINGNILHRIKALKDFGNVKKGDIGGWIEKEDNLSHDGDCWVYDNAKVYNNAEVYGNAKVYVNAKVGGNAKVHGNAEVYGNADVYGNAEVYGYANVFWCALVADNAKVGGKAEVHGNASVRDNAEVYDNADVYGYAKVYDNAKVFGNASVRNEALVGGNAKINKNMDYIVFKNWWSSGRSFTWTRSNNKWQVGCFYGTGQELIDKAYSDSEESGREYERIVNYVQDVLGEPHLNRT